MGRDYVIHNEPMRSDLEIAEAAELTPIADIAAAAGIAEADWEPHGRTVAKVAVDACGTTEPTPNYVVVTAVTPTPLGEGKTTTAVGLAQGLARLGHSPVLALRQPSMGPTFGIKGGAAGAGYSQVVPMTTLNLHLTGDFHAITSAHNLLAAMIDNHLHHGNALGIDERSISWRRVLDMNDRALRNVVVGLGGRVDGVPRQSGFDITAASEVGVILAQATSLADLRTRLGRIVIGHDRHGAPVTADDLRAAGSMAVLMAEAIKPNLLQTLEHTPVLVHAGPFGNIATGNSSIIADRVGARMGDFLITEAGFGADMGAERFVNVKARTSGMRPRAAVLVTTVRASKLHSGRFTVVPGRPLPTEMLAESPDDVLAGADNLRRHIEICRDFGMAPVVAVNRFGTDHDSEVQAICDVAAEAGVRVAVSTHVADGGAGAEELAEQVVAACAEPGQLRFTYDLSDPLETKIEKVATRVYGADCIDIARSAARDLTRFTEQGYGDLPVVIAKTHLSLSADPTALGAPTGWRLPVRDVRLAAGAGYVYAICGEMRTMPGLGSHPAAERIDIDEQGRITGLF